MIWCRFEKDGAASYGIVEGDTVIAVDGDPFGRHTRTSTRHKLSEVKLLVPVLPPTFYAIGSNYRTHVIERSKAKGFKEPKFYDRPRVGYRANSALIATGDEHREADGFRPALRIRGRTGRGDRQALPQRFA